MMSQEVRPCQVWDIYSYDEKRWRRVSVVNVLMNKVELLYLDMPETPDVARTAYADLGRMEREPQSYRFVSHGG
jgi:hypothetical protein